ncbi:hypothetical protein RND81_08G184600 [Saponaria officinalis]|uniref:Ribosomal protein S2 n=1 Tax=Saponaria officinalis TaxID=3572 RepID=A0AAW1JBZ5_SAPOF
MPIHAAVIQKLLSTNAHVGRRITAHHLKPYLHGTRNSLSIVDADKTLISLRSALDFISHLARTRFQAHTHTRPARFLFVNTNPLYDHIFDHMTRLTGFGSFLSPQSQFWRLGGFLTNPHSPKKFRGRNKRLCFAPVDPPDCVVVVDPDLKCSVIDEANRVGVPVVALVDSKTPLDVYEKIAYPIVCGGESVQFVYMLCNLITKTFLLEQKLSSQENGGVVDEVVVADADPNVLVDTLVSGNVDGGVGDDVIVLNVDSSSEQATVKDSSETEDLSGSEDEAL